MQYGRYQVIDEVGRGSMGVVYKAHDPHIDRIIALKVLREDRVASEDFVRRFLKEATAVGRLSHPGIVTVYDVGQDHGSIYIAMEFLEGNPLDSLINNQRLNLEKIVDIASQIADALHYAHQHGIVHRDIKPPNIICNPQGMIKVTDFGIARIEDPGGHQMTQVGEILGTPLYMSPEQVMGQPLDGRSDLFSLGVILYQLTTGRRPFEGSTLAAIFHAITENQPQLPHVIDAAIPRALSDLIMRLLEKESVRRFASGEELRRALATCLSFSQGKVREGQKNNSDRKPPSSWRIFVAGFILVVVVVLGGGYYYLQVQKAPPDRALFDKTAQPIDTSASEKQGPLPSGDNSKSKEITTKSDGDLLNKGNTISGDDLKKVSKLPGDKDKSTNQIGKVGLGKATLLKVDTRPPGAEIYLDGERAGITPITLTTSAEKHEVKLRLAKHLGWDAQLDLSKGGEVPLSIQLLPEAASNP
jgi:eukaryotic-like serine/threonine-protein kinase